MSAEHPVQEGLRRRSANVNSLWFLPHSLLIKKSPQEHSHLSLAQPFAMGAGFPPSHPHPSLTDNGGTSQLLPACESSLCSFLPPLCPLPSYWQADISHGGQDSAIIRIKASNPQAGSPACPCWWATLLHRPTHPGHPEPLREAGGWTLWGMLGIKYASSILSRAFQLVTCGASPSPLLARCHWFSNKRQNQQKERGLRG